MLRLLGGNLLSYLLARLKSFAVSHLCHNQMDGAHPIQNLFDMSFGIVAGSEQQ
jgi:hypothetical protein